MIVSLHDCFPLQLQQHTLESCRTHVVGKPGTWRQVGMGKDELTFAKRISRLFRLPGLDFRKHIVTGGGWRVRHHLSE